MIYNWPVSKQKTESSETWVINSSPEVNPGNSYTINFISNGKSFKQIIFASETKFSAPLYYDDIEVANGHGSSRYVFDNEAYRTVKFLEPPTGKLLTWLQANAVKQ